MLTVYLETNVWDALQHAGGLQSDVANQLLAARRRAQVRMLAGSMVFTETEPLYETNPSYAVERMELMEALSDLSSAVGPHLLAGAVEAAILNHVHDPFTDAYADIGAVRDISAEHRAELAAGRAAALEKDNAFVEEMKIRCAETKADLARDRHLRKMTFPEFETLRPFREEDFVGRYYQGDGRPLPKELVARIARQRPVHMYHEGLDSMVYGQMILGRKPRPSDLRDLHHAVAASVTQGLVSEDGPFREWCGRVSLPDFQVFSLDELLRLISR